MQKAGDSENNSYIPSACHSPYPNILDSKSNELTGDSFDREYP